MIGEIKEAERDKGGKNYFGESLELEGMEEADRDKSELSDWRLRT